MNDNGQVWRNRLYTLILGTAVAALAWVWRFDSPPPGLWDAFAVAAGLRPPAEQLPMMWHAVVAPLFSSLGITGATKVLMAAGPVALGIFAVLVCGLFERLLPASLRRGEHVASWWRASVRFVVYQGAAFLCLSDPVWNAFRCFSPTALHLLATVAAAILFIDQLAANSRPKLVLSFAIFGLLAADSPFGATLALLATVATGIGSGWFRRGAQRIQADNPIVHSRMAWDMTLAFIGGMAAGTVLNARAYAAAGGLDAQSWSWGDFAAALPSCYLKSALPGRAAAGIAFAVAAMVVALLVEVELLRRSTDGDRHLKYFHGVAFAAFGIISFSQLTGAKSLWLWSWLPDAGPADIGFILCLFMVACALSFTWTVAVFTMELYLRDFERVARLMFPDEAERSEGVEAIAAVKRLQRVVRAILCVEPFLALAAILPFRPQRL